MNAKTTNARDKSTGTPAREESGAKGEPDFETALSELESVVEQLESGELSLSQSLEQFKRGVGLSKRCHQLIDEARHTVEKLADPDDESSAEPFGDEAGSD